MSVLFREAWNEFRCGLKSGVVSLIYVVLVGYLLLFLNRADYLRNMGAVDVPRNAPALVYLMISGSAFFLYFAWAWVFAQPILRDREAGLHEVVLAAPVSLRQLLAGRFLGALGIALVLGSSQIVGFLVAPLLEWLGVVPPHSFAAVPWLAFGWASLLFLVPLALGSGSLYFIATLRRRSLSGPFAVAALLMAFWMLAMVILKEGHVNPAVVTLLDPSGYAEVEHQVIDNWTPQQKRGALLTLTPPLLWNRLLWGGLPLGLLLAALWRVRGEQLVLEHQAASSSRQRFAKTNHPPMGAPPGPVAVPCWWRAAWGEAGWQLRQLFGRRWMFWTLVLLLLLGVAGGFVHVVQHAYGPLVPRPELVTPLLSRTFYVIIVFMLAGLVGVAARRDEQPGLLEMLDAAPAPPQVRMVGRVMAALAVTLVLAVTPALSGMLVTAWVAPGSLRLLLPLFYQLTVLAPALLEIAALTILLHALIRRPGPAYAASVLAAFIAIVNQEVELVTYPPLQFGLRVPVGLSGATGWLPWLEKILLSGGFKLALALMLLCLAALVAPRGCDTGWRVRWRGIWQRLTGRAACCALGALLLVLGLFGALLHQRYRVEGDYQSLAARLADDAAWEKRWLDGQGGFTVTGGHVELEVDAVNRVLTGAWRLRGVRTEQGVLHAELPHNFRLTAARVQGRPVRARVAEDHLALPLEGCPAAGCEVELAWTLPVRGYDAECRPAWLLRQGYWLDAAEVLPRLGFDGDRVLRTPGERVRFGLPAAVKLPDYRAALASGAAAPVGEWTWRVTLSAPESAAHVRQGRLRGLLDFADIWAPRLRQTVRGEVTLIHDASREATALAVAEDLADMRACVARRLGTAPVVRGISQWPRDLGASRLAGEWLLLAEDPYWDVAPQGVGRWVRRAALATELARRVVRDGADLREGEGTMWLSEGLPGAIGLLCVADSDGPEALLALAARGADRVVGALAGSVTPVGPLKYAETDSWATDYAPLAALDWSARQSPDGIAALLRQVREEGNIGAALTARVGADAAASMLGPPNASDVRVAGAPSGRRVAGERWQWRTGGWVSLPDPIAPTIYGRENGALLPVPLRASDRHPPLLYLDGWPAYEREPADNLWSGGS